MAVCETILKDIKIDLQNHLAHHWTFNMVLLSAIAVEAVAFLVLVIKHVL
jgi:hypothetical protein